MSELNELAVLIAVRDVAVGQLSLDRLDQRIGAALGEARRPQRRWPSRRLTPLFVGIGVLVPVLIAIGAVVLLSRPSRSVAPPTAPTTLPQAVARRQLIEMLGVLRRPPDAASTQAINCAKSPPTPASRAFPACRTADLPPEFSLPDRQSSFEAQFGYPRLDPSLIRVVSVPRFHARVVLAPATWRPSLRSPLRTEGLVLSISYARGSSGTGPKPTPVSTVRAHGLAVSGGNATPQMRTVFGAVVVPDGVATVTLDPIRVTSPPAPVDPREFGTVSTAVQDNVALFQFNVPYVKDPHVKSLVYAVTVIANATWTDQHGHVITHTTTPLPLWLKVRGTTPITATN
jgi:hypothetical protein